MKSCGRFAIASALSVSVSVIVAAPASFAACQIEKVAELAVTTSDLRPTVDAKIDGREIRLLADTGAFYSMISPAKAAEMKLLVRPAPFDLTVAGVGGVMRASVATIKDFRLASMSLRQVEFIVGGSESGVGVDGVLGRNLLTGFDSEYDLGNGVIRLMRPTGCGSRALAYWRPDDYSAVDMVIGEEIGGHPEIIVPVSVNGKDLKATLDTGASNTVIWRSAAVRAGISVAPATGAGDTYTSGVGRRQVRENTASMATFKIAGEEIKNTQVSVVETALDGSDMLLGADFFLAHRVYVSNAQHKVYFTYSGGPVFRLGTTPVVVATPASADEALPDATKPRPDTEPTDAAGFSRRGQA